MSGEFTIKATLDLDTSSAESKIDSFKDQKIPMKLSLSSDGFLKQTKDNFKEYNNIAKRSYGISSQDFSKTMKGDLENFRKNLQEKDVLERKYLRSRDENEKKQIEKDLNRKRESLRQQYDGILKDAQKNSDVNKEMSLKALTYSYMGKDGFNSDRSAKELLDDWKAIDTMARRNRDTFNNLRGDITKDVIQNAKKKNEDVIHRLNDSKINEDNRRMYERRAEGYRQIANASKEMERAEFRFDEALRKERRKANKIENEEYRKQALQGLNELETKKNNLRTDGNIKTLASSFDGLTNKVKDYSVNIDKIARTGRKVDTDFSKDVKMINDKRDKVEKTLSGVNHSIAKDMAKKLDLQGEADKILANAKGKRAGDVTLKQDRKSISSISEQASRLKTIDTLGESIDRKFQKARKSMVGFTDDNVKRKATELLDNVQRAYKEVDKSKPENTIKDMHKVSSSLDDIGKVSKNLMTLDKMVRRINSSDLLSPEQKKDLVSLTTSKGLGSLGTSAFDVGMNQTSTQLKSLNKIQREQISDQKRFTREVEKTSNKAKDLTNSYRNIKGSIADKYAKQNVSDISGVMTNLASPDIDRKGLNTAQRTLDVLTKRRNLIQEMNGLEVKNTKNFDEISTRLSGFNNLVTQHRGKTIFDSLNNSYQKLDTGKIGSTTKNMSAFRVEIEKAGKSSTQLNALDNSLNRLAVYENNMKPREINKFRKAYVDLSKSDLLGTPKFDANLKKINTGVRAVSRYRTTLDNLKSDFKSSLMGSSLGYLAGYGVRTALKGTMSAYKELDASMVNIKKVADQKDVNTVAKIEGITQKAITTAKQVGKSSADVQNAIATSIQSGMGSMEASMKVARKSMILSNIGDMDENEATKAVNTIVKSYNLDPLKKKSVTVRGLKKETDELTNALDMLNHVG